MSFIYNLFASDNSTPAEKENAAALKVMIKDHMTALTSEYKQHEIEYKQALEIAESEYKRAKEQAKMDVIHKTLDAVKREVDIITTTDEFANSDAKTKAKIEGCRAWISSASELHFRDESYGPFADEKYPEMVVA
ncbi:hypothetical protein EDD21DRAFT_353854 [Dissophora ornata]|nr:hypothetical protein EDD21DRAFT_353854 [Dissophora ornata]